MESLSHSRSNSGVFRSRRSYGNLQHVSLAPLTSRFPLDDDDGEADDSVIRGEGDHFYHSQPPITSYYSTTSVPTTPPVLSHSHNVSSMNLARKRKTKTTPLSDTDLSRLDTQRPAHHQRTRSHNPRESHRPWNGNIDNEWLLRAGLALATSTREEKGQSWLVQRESSTSLVADVNRELDHRPHLSRSQTARRIRSGMSTPMALSRRGSRSQIHSPQSSKASFMAGMDGASGFRSGTMTPYHDQAEYIPDFVDSKIRNEMQSIISKNGYSSPPRGDASGSYPGIASPKNHGHGSHTPYLLDASVPPSEPDYSGSDSDDDSEIGEIEMQRLTRQRGFGLGPWVDRLVEWTLFSVDEESPPMARTQWTNEGDNSLADDAMAKTDGVSIGIEPGPPDSEVSSDCPRTEAEDDSSSLSSTEESYETGGWADVKWLLRVARNAL